ncbi:MAG TPA: hypothetical protein PK156_51640, partial [Polyangium sp.]|nr:hypothetical protein [Polyangium sp.]
MRFTPRLHLDTLHGPEIDASLLAELYALRRDLIDLRPDVREEEDFASFQRFFTSDGARVTLMRQSNASIVGFLGWYAREVPISQGNRVAIDADYFFMKSSLRGHFMMSALAFDCYARGALEFKNPHVAIVGHGYPSSVISGGRFSDRVRFLQDADVTSWERDVMVAFAERFCAQSFDREKEIICMRTLPRESRRLPRVAKAREILARFEAYNPD